MIKEDIYLEIFKFIEEIKEKVKNKNISLLDEDLSPIFIKIKNYLSISNLAELTELYGDACNLLNDKFRELRLLLESLDSEKKFLEFLSFNPSDSEIFNLIKSCWTEPFNIESISYKYLRSCGERLNQQRDGKIEVEEPIIESIPSDYNYEIEISEENFYDNMMQFYNNLKEKLPCYFDEAFDDYEDPWEAFQNFISLLHLLQLGKIKYQKETNFLYIDEVDNFE